MWFGGDGVGTMSTVTNTDSGLLFVRLKLDRAEIDDQTRQQLAAELVNTAISHIRFGPPPPVEADLCALISDEDAERLLAPHRQGRAAARDEIFGGGSPQVVDLAEFGDSDCQKLILTEIYVTASMAAGTDFGPDAQIDGVDGSPISGIGDEAIWFADVPGGGSFAAPHDTDIVAVRWGRAAYRVVLALPDLSPSEQRDAVTALALTALTRLPDYPGEVFADHVEPVDLSDRSYVDNLITKVADGEWTLGEGLVATLGLFVGDTQATAVLRTPELADDSGTELMQLAQAYVAESPTTSTTREITRLLELLALPTAGVNDQPETRRSSPGGTLTASTRSLFDPSVRTLFQTEEGEEQVQEDDEEVVESPDEDRGYAPPPEFPDDAPDLPPHEDPWDIGQCGEASGNGWTAVPAYFADGADPVKAQVIYPESGFPPGWNETHLVWTTEAVQETLDLYTADASPCLHILLSTHGGASSYVLDTSTTGICGIFLNIPMQVKQEAQFKQEIARNIAHCIIPINWPSQFDVANFTKRRWWNGALAEFLSNVVYPDPTCNFGRCDLEWRHAPTLAATELGTPMMERQAGNWLFFQYLWWTQGLEGVIGLVDRLPGSVQPIDHEQAVAGIAGMEEIFHTFVEQLSDAAVLDSGGGNFAYQPESQRLPISGEATIQRGVQPFGTKRLHLVIEPGMFGCIESSTEGEVRLTYRTGAPGGGGGAWEMLPTEETPYSGELVVVGTSTQPDGSFSLTVNKVTDEEDCEEEEEPPPISTCLSCPVSTCAAPATSTKPWSSSPPGLSRWSRQ